VRWLWSNGGFLPPNLQFSRFLQGPYEHLGVKGRTGARKVDKTYAHISLRDIANLRSVALLLANGIEGTGTFTGVNAVQRSMSGSAGTSHLDIRDWAAGFRGQGSRRRLQQGLFRAVQSRGCGAPATLANSDGRGKAELISAPHNLGNHGGLICCVHKGTNSPA
jgi:hypothetical protein